MATLHETFSWLTIVWLREIESLKARTLGGDRLATIWIFAMEDFILN